MPATIQTQQAESQSRFVFWGKFVISSIVPIIIACLSCNIDQTMKNISTQNRCIEATFNLRSSIANFKTLPIEKGRYIDGFSVTSDNADDHRNKYPNSKEYRIKLETSIDEARIACQNLGSEPLNNDELWNQSPKHPSEQWQVSVINHIYALSSKILEELTKVNP